MNYAKINLYFHKERRYCNTNLFQDEGNLLTVLSQIITICI